MPTYVPYDRLLAYAKNHHTTVTLRTTTDGLLRDVGANQTISTATYVVMHEDEPLVTVDTYTEVVQAICYALRITTNNPTH